MTENSKSILLQESISIADSIISQKCSDKNGIYWKTMGIDYSNNNSLIWQVSENIYSGTSGIALFLMSLFKITDEQKYLVAAENAMEWVIYHCINTDSSNYSFLTGRMSVPFVLAKLSDISKNNYLESALAIAKDCDVVIKKNRTVCEYLNGTSGTLLSLLHLYDATNEKWIIKKIESLIDYLVTQSYLNIDGIHWDRNSDYIKSLCGLSHGAAGIGFVLYEIGHYFNHPALLEFADKVFKYEDKYYNKEENNWQDLRRSIFTKQDERNHRKAIFENNEQFFVEAKYMNAWCHGAPGIGLTRLRAYIISQQNKYKIQYENSKKKVMDTWQNTISDNNTLTLCHGIGGNLDLLIEAKQMLKDNTIDDTLDRITDNLSKYISKRNSYMSGLYLYAGKNEDLSLFNGNSGIGYFYLRLLDSSSIESILLPSLKSPIDKINYKPDIIENITTEKMYTKIVQKVFPKTLGKYYKLQGNKSIGRYLESLITSGPTVMNNYGDTISPGEMPSKNRQNIKIKPHALELAKYNLDSNVKSYALLKSRALFQPELITNIIEDITQLLETVLVINPDTKLMKLEDDWREGSTTDSKINNRKENYVLLFATNYGVLERNLSPLSYLVLEQFLQRNQVNKVIDNLEKEFNADKKIKSQIFGQSCIEQIKEMLRGCVLLKT